MIGEGDIPCVSVTDIEKDLWAKMLYNCALNPLGAILDMPYGVLADIRAGKRTEIGALTDAVLGLAEKQNISVPYNRAVYDIMKFLER